MNGRLVGAKSRSTRKRSRASRWKRRGRLRARMAARVHLTPIFPARGSAALSAHRRRPHSLSRSRPGPRSRLCHFFAPSPLFSILEDPKSLRWGTKAHGPQRLRKPPLSPFAPAPLTLLFASALTLSLPTHPIHPYLTAILLLSSLLQLVLPSFFSSCPYTYSPILTSFPFLSSDPLSRLFSSPSQSIAIRFHTPARFPFSQSTTENCESPRDRNCIRLFSNNEGNLLEWFNVK